HLFLRSGLRHAGHSTHPPATGPRSPEARRVADVGPAQPSWTIRTNPPTTGAMAESPGTRVEELLRSTFEEYAERRIAFYEHPRLLASCSTETCCPTCCAE